MSVEGYRALGYAADGEDLRRAASRIDLADVAAVRQAQSAGRKA